MSLLLLTLLCFPMVNAADSTVATNTTWSGSVTLNGNVTVASSATLTLAPGTTVDAGEYALIVEGTLIAEDSTFYSSVPPLTQGSHGQGLWVGLVIESLGTATLTNVTVANASAAVAVKGELSGTDLTFNDAYRGLAVLGGTAVVDGLNANRIDYEAVYAQSGDLNLSNAIVEEVAVGLSNQGDSVVDQFTVREAGIGVRAVGGDLTLTGLGLVNVSVGIAAVSGATANISSVVGTGLALAVDAGDADGLELRNAVMTGERFLVGQGVTSMLINDLSFTGTGSEDRYVMDVGCDGTCSLSDASFDNVAKGLSWSGAGTYDIDGLDLEATVVGLEAAGSGHLVLTNASVATEGTGLSVQSPTSALHGVNVRLMSQDAQGVDILGGSHIWGSLAVDKSFQSSDRTSVGVAAWYATLSADALSVYNVSTALRLEDSQAEVNSFEANIGSVSGLHLIDASYVGSSMVTVAQDEGVLMEGTTSLHVGDWTARLHDTPLMMSTGSTAVVRTFSPQNTAPTSSDALGDGVLYYGSAGNPSVATGQSYRLIETSVTFTDLQGQPVEADVTVHGFELMSNVNGALTLPLVASGSLVDVTLQGAGVRVTLYGGQTGQSVQVPVIPQGDWTVASGQNIVLGPRPDGAPHQLSGHLVINNNAQLTLQSTTLVVPIGKTTTVQGTGVLQGSSARLVSPSVQASGQSMVSGNSGSLTLASEMVWGCLSARSVNGLMLEGNLTVQPNCEIDLYDGYVQGNVVAQTGASFTSHSSIEINVLDKGQPVEGALISIDGSVGLTNNDGSLSSTGVARTVTDTGETWSGSKMVTLQRNNFTDFVMWDTNQSLQHTFMASTVPSQDVTGWLVLERQWSPYTLDTSITVLASSTLTVQDGVSLRLSEGVSITVNGVLDVGQATLSSTGFGARWAGLRLGPSSAATIDLQGSSLVESSPALFIDGAGEVTATGAFFARSIGEPLVVVDTGNTAQLTIRNSRMQDSGDSCITLYPSSRTVTLDNVTLASCDGSAVWAQQVPVNIHGLVVDSGSEQGVEFTGVTGQVRQLNAMAYDGAGSILSLNSMTSAFTLEGLNGQVTGDGGIVGAYNTDLTLSDITLHGAPAIDVDHTSGWLSDVELIGTGSGTAITAHHGRSSAGLTFSHLNITDYSVGVSLHADPGEISAPLVLTHANIAASTALAAEQHPARLESSTMDGDVAISNTHVVALDTLLSSTTLDNGGELRTLRTAVLDARRGGVPVEADFTVAYSDQSEAPLQVAGTTVDVTLLLEHATEQSTITMANWTVTAQVSGSPSATVVVESPGQASPLIVVNVPVNQPPTVVLTEPSPGQRVMEGDFLRASATVSDDLDESGSLVLAWKVYDMQNRIVLEGGNEPVYNITDLSAGFYVVEVTATDTLGLQSTASMDFEYTQLDTDGDWSSSCSSTTWFDPQTGKSCGPNLYDEDDDNDGVSDSNDAFPLDPCAYEDTDGDTQPDELDCPPGFTSWLTEDMDDDGDGTPDVLEGVSVGDNETNTNALMVVLALLVVVVVMFFARLRKGGPGDLTGLDQRHL